MNDSRNTMFITIENRTGRKLVYTAKYEHADEGGLERSEVKSGRVVIRLETKEEEEEEIEAIELDNSIRVSNEGSEDGDRNGSALSSSQQFVKAYQKVASATSALLAHDETKEQHLEKIKEFERLIAELDEKRSSVQQELTLAKRCFEKLEEEVAEESKKW